MPAAISNFVDVTIALDGAVADAFGFGAACGVFDHSVTANRLDGPYTSVAEVVAAGFTSGAEPEVYAWATAALSQTNGIDQIYIGREDSGDADWTATLDAVWAANPGAWYWLNVETRAEAEILLVAAWAEAKTVFYVAQTGDAAVPAGTAGNVLLDLQAANYSRTAGFYHATSTGSDGYLDGAATGRVGGFNLDAPGGRGVAFGKQLSGVTFDVLTPTEVANIYAANGNLNVRAGSDSNGLSFISKGTTAAGAPQFIDITTTSDWVEKRVEERVIEGFVGTPTVIPYTNEGINTVSAWVQEVLDRGVSFGHFSPDTPPFVEPLDVAAVSSAVKATRVLTLTAQATLAGGIQKLAITINVQY